MPMNLSIIISKIKCVPNATNVALLDEFYDYLTRNGAGENHIKNELYANIQFAMFLGKDVTFHDVDKKTIIDYLDTPRKPKKTPTRMNAEKRLGTTTSTPSSIFRWLHNQRGKEDLTDPPGVGDSCLRKDKETEDRAPQLLLRARGVEPRRHLADNQICNAYQEQGGARAFREL